MRLLRVRDLRFENFIGQGIPDYAILSHRWHVDEAMLLDVQMGSSTTTQGMMKVYGFVNYVKENIPSIEYVWIDTCCIDQKSNPEVSESINSMFRWYSNARVCIAYLRDVDNDDSSFEHSEWFSRGWTLQELLASQVVVFLSRDWKVIGHKGPDVSSSITRMSFHTGPLLNRRVADATNIPESVLQDFQSAVATLDKDDIFKWMENRQTTREEDESYCLLGLLGVNMNIRYGEGRDPTKQRLLRKINKKQFPDVEHVSETGAIIGNVSVSLQAAFDASSKQNDPLCLESTRADVLKQIRAWVTGNEPSCIFWLNGMAGTGKSTIARTIARELNGKHYLGASYFFVRGSGPAVSNAAPFFTTIANQLAIAMPEVRPHMTAAIEQQPDIGSKSRDDQWNRLIVEPFANLTAPTEKLVVIIVDALDECDDDKDMRGIVNVLARANEVPNIRLRVIITSRPETPIRLGFKKLPEILHQDLLLHDQPRPTTDGDICLFLYNELEDIREAHGLPGDWPTVDQVNQLVRAAGGLFIFAATACRFLLECDDAEDSLELFLRADDELPASATPDIADEAQNQWTVILDEIYSQILTRANVITAQILTSYRSNDGNGHITGLMASLAEPVNIEILARLLQTKTSVVNHRLEKLHSIVRMSKAVEEPIRFFHASFRDFLLQEHRSGPMGFYLPPKTAHSRLLQGCFAIMHDGLHRNMCDLEHSGVQYENIGDAIIDRMISPALKYACRYWTYHWERSESQDNLVAEFVGQHFLHWLETMSLLDLWDEASLMIASSVRFQAASAWLQDFLRDALRLMSKFRPCVGQCPTQIYEAVLFFAPRSSVIRKTFQDQRPQWISMVESKEQEDWDSCLQILWGHAPHPIRKMSFVDNGKYWVSATSTAVRMWDTVTGVCTQRIDQVPSDYYQIAFAPDGNLIAMTSDDCIQLWSIRDGTKKAELEDDSSHGSYVTRLIFSPASTLLASASEDNVIRVWDVQRGLCLRELKDHSGAVTKMMFSSDGRVLASLAPDHELCLWEVSVMSSFTLLTKSERQGRQTVGARKYGRLAFSSNGRILATSDGNDIELQAIGRKGKVLTLTGHSKSTTAIAFSPDNTLLVSGSLDKTLRIWDTSTGSTLCELHGHQGMISSASFALRGEIVISTSRHERLIYVWDVASRRILHTLGAHHDNIVGTAVSSTVLASYSRDSMIQFWDLATVTSPQPRFDRPTPLRDVYHSQSEKLVVATSLRGLAIRVFDTTTEQDTKKLIGHEAYVWHVKISPDDRLVASVSADGTLRIWDIAKSCEIHRVEYRGLPTVRSQGLDIGILNPHSKNLSSSSDIVPIWDLLDERSVLNATKCVTLMWVAISHSGRMASLDEAYVLRSLPTGTFSSQWHIEFPGQDCCLTSIAFCAAQDLFAAVRSDGKLQTWSTNSGNLLWQRSLSNVSSLDFSSDGKLLAASRSYNVALLDASTGMCVHRIRICTDSAQRCTFGKDGSSLRVPGGFQSLKCLNIPGSFQSLTCRHIPEASESLTCEEFACLYPAAKSSRSRHSVIVDDDWLFLDGRRRLWLPSEYDAWCVYANEEKIFIMHQDGSSSIWRLHPP